VVPIVEVFADVVCPFTHVGLRRFIERRAAAGRPDVVLRVRAWPLELVNGEPLDPAAISAHVEELREVAAPDLFQGFDAAALPPSSIPALALGVGANRLGDEVGERVALALRDALFEEGLDLGDPAVLDGIARQAVRGSISHDDRGKSIHDGAWAASVDEVVADWEEGRRRGVRGSPEFSVGGHDWFCPALAITRVAGGLHVEPDPAAFESFLSECFAA
jgi:predicted DsbA family dithiol-disulfide isomerase